jgi:NADPH-dependent 2,4-dienoyl-CoA reductase/sulfur reductase-like enzyme/peroxiredoxin family protein/rhodanese-related sulfurtransferase/TusA-related sulfurtransferase
MAKKIVIVGGVAGGASTATRLRRLDETAEIILLEKGAAISYANCGLPYYIGGTISEREELFLQTPAGMKRRFRIDVRVRHEVLQIDPARRELSVRDHQAERTYSERYDELVLSPGSAPFIPPIPGTGLPQVFTLRNIPDTDRIKEYLAAHPVESALVVGGGFIGLEMAENLAHTAKRVTLLELADQVLANLDYEMAAPVQQELRGQGIELLLGHGLAAIEQAGPRLAATLRDGTKLVADIVILAVGVRPETRLAEAAGLALGSTGAIRVNERLQTSDPHIYAVGDAVEVREWISGRPAWLPLAGPANRQGRLLADILAGREARYPGAQGTAIVKVFDLSAASTGLNEKTLRQWGIPYRSSITHSNSHAGYYPGATPLSIKLLFAPEDGRLLGAQAVGAAGVDKRIDILATAIRFEKTVYDLTDLELAYAPPFSSAKDPVNIAGYTASNILDGAVAVATWEQVAGEPAGSGEPLLLDVREPVEFQLGAIPGAVNLPLDQLRERLAELPQDRPIVAYCQVGLRAYLAARILMQHGFTGVQNLSGGYKTLRAALQERELLAGTARRETAGTAAGPGSAPAAGPAPSGPEEPPVPVNACGLQCPGPILKLYQAMGALSEGQTLEIAASDPGFANDVAAWCARTGNTLLQLDREPGRITARIRKGGAPGADAPAAHSSPAPAGAGLPQDKTIVVFSGDLDKAIASFIIATGAAAMGRKVTMFFTFWGLNILRRPQRVKVRKTPLGRMFGLMMPRGSTRLGLSRMNMAGIGPKMIRMVMGGKHIASLEELIAEARALGIRLVACQMSMDVMGIHPAELLDGVEIGGVASYLAAAEEGNVNLFI